MKKTAAQGRGGRSSRSSTGAVGPTLSSIFLPTLRWGRHQPYQSTSCWSSRIGMFFISRCRSGSVSAPCLVECYVPGVRLDGRRADSEKKDAQEEEPTDEGNMDFRRNTSWEKVQARRLPLKGLVVLRRNTGNQLRQKLTNDGEEGGKKMTDPAKGREPTKMLPLPELLAVTCRAGKGKRRAPQSRRCAVRHWAGPDRRCHSSRGRCVAPTARLSRGRPRRATTRPPAVEERVFRANTATASKNGAH